MFSSLYIILLVSLIQNLIISEDINYFFEVSFYILYCLFSLCAFVFSVIIQNAGFYFNKTSYPCLFLYLVFDIAHCVSAEVNFGPYSSNTKLWVSWLNGREVVANSKVIPHLFSLLSYLWPLLYPTWILISWLLQKKKKLTLFLSAKSHTLPPFIFPPSHKYIYMYIWGCN